MTTTTVEATAPASGHAAPARAAAAPALAPVRPPRPLRVTRLPGTRAAVAEAGDAAWEVPPTQGTLALALGPPAPTAPPRRPVLSVVGTAPAPDVHQDDERDEQRADRVRWCGQLAVAVVEVLAGTRPAAQLLRWTTTEVQSGVVRRAAVARRAREALPTPARTRLSRPAALRAVRACEPADGVVEAAAVVLDRGRARAVAVRLEEVGGRWRATALDVL